MKTRSMAKRERFNSFFVSAPNDVIDVIFSYISDKIILLSKRHIKDSYIYESFLKYIKSMSINILGAKLHMIYFFKWLKLHNSAMFLIR